MQPYASRNAAVDFLGDEGEARVRDAYGENYARLVEVKSKYDPTSFFHLNQGIKPSVRTEAAW